MIENNSGSGSMNLAALAPSKVQTETAGILIKPDLSSFCRSDINQTKELIDAGYQEAMVVLKGHASLD
ncbi:MAG: hypothetical protein ACI8QD_002894 [Cyclobacteriaceae bacterium]|jgi:hypothetical protein